MIEAHAIELIASGGFTTLVGVVGYFMKKQNEKIESFDSKVITVRNELQKNIKDVGENLAKDIKDSRADLLNDMKESKAEVVNIFQNVCHERQNACGRVFDQKLETIRKEGKSVCRKIDSIKDDRADRWKKQEVVNDKFKTHIAQSKEITI